MLELAKVEVSEREPDEPVLEMLVSTAKLVRISNNSRFMISGPVLIDFTEIKELRSSASCISGVS